MREENKTFSFYLLNVTTLIVYVYFNVKHVKPAKVMNS